MQYHNKNKVRYDAQFLPVKFKVSDNVMHEEFHYPNTCKLTSSYFDPYKILNQLSEVSFVMDRPNPHFKRSSEITVDSLLTGLNGTGGKPVKRNSG